MKRSSNKGTFYRVIKYLRHHAVLLMITLILAVVSVSLSLYLPILVGDAIDNIIGEGNTNHEAVMSIISEMAFMIAVVAVSQWFIGILNNRMTFSIVKKLRMDAFAKIQKLPVSYIDSHGHGATVSRIVADVDTFSDGLLLGLTQLFTGILTILGTLVFMLTIDVKIALIVVVLTPASMIVSKFIASSTFRLFRKQAEAREIQTSLTEEIISNVKTVKAFSMEDEMTEKFEDANNELKKISVKAIFYSSLVNPSTRFVNGIIYAVVAFAGALSGISAGGLTCFLGYANQYTKPFNEISGVITEFQNALACASRIFELLDETEISDDDDRAELAIPVRGDIVIENLKFSYVPDRPLIDNFNVSIKAGQKVAIVGPTGCGKTTIINLLMRFYDAIEGTIYIDGVNIYEISRNTLRRNYGMVLQDTWIKKGTVAENIALGKPDSTMDEIISAAKAVHAHSFIKRLSKGYDTVIGDESSSLSQGQRQLISIARIMLCRPSVLILDEATSSIDTRTEAKIQAAFDKLTKNRTSFIVAHRLATIKNADVILVMKDGNVVETGSHTELLHKGGFYSRIYESQFLKTE
ncbi:MAG: ABC transporter ATP-binding protein [Clostridia bacterium]|nr:ABC transporter ATP-binding protein [Clostridia bacterium]